jgi:putative DNA primase/helicase
MWRRIRLIPFNRTFDGKDQDKTLKGRLQAEAAGILAWAVQGCLEWQRRGLNAPAVVDEATQAYRKESDTLGNFLEECCEVGERLVISSADLWKAYSNWAIENGVGGLNRKAFKNRLESRGFKARPIGHRRTRSFVGLGLKPFPEGPGVASARQEELKALDEAVSRALPSAFNCLIPQ